MAYGQISGSHALPYQLHGGMLGGMITGSHLQFSHLPVQGGEANGKTITAGDATAGTALNSNFANASGSILMALNKAISTIADDAIDGDAIADNAIDSEHYTNGSIDEEHFSTLAFNSLTGSANITKVGTIASGVWSGTALVKAKIGADAIDGTKIEDDAVDSEHIAAGAIDLAHMSVNSVDSDQYVDGSIDLVHMSVNSVDSDQYVDGSIDLAHMSANSVDSAQYVDGSIDEEHFATLAFNSLTGSANITEVGTIASGVWSGTALVKAKIGADAIDGTKIEDDAVDSEHIAAGAIDLAHMSVNSVDSDQYVDGSIDTAHFAAGAVDAAAMGANSVDSSELVNGSIDASHISGTPVFNTLTGSANVTEVGALANGSIAAGFGAIDNGTSNITTGGLLKIDVDSGVTVAADVTGLGAAGSLTLGVGGDAGLYVVSDDLYIDNKTTDKDVIFRASKDGDYTEVARIDGSAGTFKVSTAGTFNYGGTLVTATAAELNLLDATAGSSVTLADGDAIIIGDASAATANTKSNALMSDVMNYIGTMFAGNTESGITASYQSADQTVDLEVECVAANITDNAIGAAQIVSNGVGTLELKAGSITGPKFDPVLDHSTDGDYLVLDAGINDCGLMLKGKNASGQATTYRVVVDGGMLSLVVDASSLTATGAAGTDGS